MPMKSRWNVHVPNVSIPTYLFGSPFAALSDKMALADAEKPESHYLTLNSWRLFSKRVAVGLQNAGFKPGDRVLLFSGNTLLFPVVFMGVLFAEGIFTGANPTYTARELAHQLKDSGALYLLTADDHGSLETAIEAAELAGLSKDSIFIFDDAPYEGQGDSRLGVRHWNTLIAPKAEGELFAWKELEDSRNTTCALNYSSGTTGLAKGVQISHYNYVANTVQVLHLAQQDPDFEKFNKSGRWLCYLPLYHAMAQSTFLMNGPNRGIPCFIMKKFDFVKMLETIEKFRITELALVPPIVIAMAKSPISRKYDLSSVRKALSGAAPLGREVSIEFESLWPEGKLNLKQGWGMTELTCSLLGWDPKLRSEDSSVGELNANCEAMIMNEDGTAEVRRGERGEIWVRGPNVMQGYWRNPQATAETLTEDGWLKTGDICFVDERGHFHVIDRKKELIKYKGNQIAPAELEAVLLEHPQIQDAAVVGVYIDGEEMPRAYVALREGSKVKPDEVALWLSERVARHKRLTGGVVLVDTIPKNPSGKILRKILREQAAREVDSINAAKARL